MGFLLRWLAAFVLVATTYNPTPWNYVRWASANSGTDLPLTVLFGLLLFVGYIIFLRATLRSIGVMGMILIAALFGSVLWVLLDRGLLSLANPRFNLWLGLVALSLILSIGMGWSIIRRRLSGQADVDDVTDDE